MSWRAYIYLRSPQTTFLGHFMGILNAILKPFFDYFGSFQLHYSTFNDGIIGYYDCLGTVEDA